MERDADARDGLPGGVLDRGIECTSHPSCGRNSLKLSHSRVCVSRKNSRMRRFSSAPKAGGRERFPGQLLRLEDRVRVGALEEDRAARGPGQILQRAIDERQALRPGRPGRRAAREAAVPGSERGEHQSLPDQARRVRHAAREQQPRALDRGAGDDHGAGTHAPFAALRIEIEHRPGPAALGHDAGGAGSRAQGQAPGPLRAATKVASVDDFASTSQP